MTPHELNLHVIDYVDKNKKTDEEGITLAYLTAYWQRVKRMPDLKKIIQTEEPKPKQQTPEQMLAFAKQMQAKIEK